MKEVYRHEFNLIQKIFSRLTTMWRINRDSIDFKWGYFAPRFGFALLLNRGGYFDSNYALKICLLWGYWSIKLPIKTRLDEGCDMPRYGIEIHDSTFWLHYGGEYDSGIGQVTGKSWITWSLPFFSWEFDWHKIQLPDGSWKLYTYEDRDKAHTEIHDYTYTLKSGEVQHRKATCYVESRQWHRKWLPFWKMKKVCIDISFNDEVGERSGSWKGGTIGCGWDMIGGETIEQALRRMESERAFN